jgi:hypothetical protein
VHVEAALSGRSLSRSEQVRDHLDRGSDPVNDDELLEVAAEHEVIRRPQVRHRGDRRLHCRRPARLRAQVWNEGERIDPSDVAEELRAGWGRYSVREFLCSEHD